MALYRLQNTADTALACLTFYRGGDENRLFLPETLEARPQTGSTGLLCIKGMRLSAATGLWPLQLKAPAKHAGYDAMCRQYQPGAALPLLHATEL
jgi:hypothetical protein